MSKTLFPPPPLLRPSLSNNIIPISVSPYTKSAVCRSAHLLCFLVFLAGKHDGFGFLRKYVFGFFVSPLRQICLLVCRLFSSVLARIKELTWESFVKFFIWQENTTDLKISTCRHFSRFDFFQHVVGLVQNFM